MRRLYAAALVGAVFLCPLAAQAAECLSVDELVQEAKAEVPSTVVHDYKGADAQLGIALVNSVPGHDKVAGDRFVTMTSSELQTGMMMTFNAGCLVQMGHAHTSTILVVIAAIEHAGHKVVAPAETPKVTPPTEKTPPVNPDASPDKNGDYWL